MSVATQSHVVVIIFRWVVAALLIVLTRAVVASSKLSVPRLLRWKLIVFPWIGIVVSLSGCRSVSACLRADWTAVDHVASRSTLQIGCRLAPETHQMSWSSRRARRSTINTMAAPSRPEPDMVDLGWSSVSVVEECVYVCVQCN